MITWDAVFSNTGCIVFGQEAGPASGRASSDVLGLARQSHLHQHIQIVLSSHSHSPLTHVLLYKCTCTLEQTLLPGLAPNSRARLTGCKLLWQAYQTLTCLQKARTTQRFGLRGPQVINHNLLKRVKQIKPLEAIISIAPSYENVATVLLLLQGPRNIF